MAKENYVLLRAESVEELQDIVNDSISEGYMPIGNVSVLNVPELNTVHYFQGVFLREFLHTIAEETM